MRLQSKSIDLLNLIVAKAGNFLLVLSTFSIASFSLTQSAFVEFGFWWNVALMIGGLALGGASSSLIRELAKTGHIGHLFDARIIVGIVVLLVTASGALALRDSRASFAALALVLGVAITAQTALISLLRTVEATAENLRASVIVVVVIPPALAAFAWMAKPDLAGLFGAIAALYVLGCCAILAVGRPVFSRLFKREAGEKSDMRRFLGATLAFSALSLFSYVMVTADFALFRKLQPADALLAYGDVKIYFERFMLPVWLVFSGAVSMSVLRSSASGSADRRFGFRVTPLILFGALGAFAAAIVGFYVFRMVMARTGPVAPFYVIALASAGYLLYAANGVLFDALVVLKGAAAALRRLAVLIVVYPIGMGAAIFYGGVEGWALFWLLANLGLFLYLGRLGIRFSAD